MEPRSARMLLTVVAAFTIAFNIGAEANKTHIWNPIFEPHARFHIVWQLASNTIMSLLAVAWLWWPFLRQGLPLTPWHVRAAASALLIEPISFIFASATIHSYDGAFFPSNVPEYDVKLVGVPVALAVFVAVAAAHAFVIGMTSKPR